jgi:hypothetical protein
MPRPDAFLCSIEYAEDWLRRARHDWRKGNTPAAIRRLMLAEAEIRHARETGVGQGAGDAGASRRLVFSSGGEAGRSEAAAARRLVSGLVAAVVLAAGIGYAAVWQGTRQTGALAVRGAEGRLSGGVGRTIVQLDTGRFLLLDPGQDSPDIPAGPGFTVTAPSADGTPGDRWSHLAAPSPRAVGVPVDLRTSSPTF